MLGRLFYCRKCSFRPFKKYSFKLFSVNNNSIFTVCLLGRPNVGKSTLINALAGESISIVDNTPGLTRDRKETVVKMFDVKVKFVDTAGVDSLDDNYASTDVIKKETIEQTRKALVLSDLGIFLVDARKGITDEDRELANWINHRKELNRKYDQNQKLESDNEKLIKEKDELYENFKQNRLGKDVRIPPIQLVINKSEDNFRGNNIEKEYVELNLGEPIYISAQHGDNMVSFLLP